MWRANFSHMHLFPETTPRANKEYGSADKFIGTIQPAVPLMDFSRAHSSNDEQRKERKKVYVLSQTFLLIKIH